MRDPNNYHMKKMIVALLIGMAPLLTLKAQPEMNEDALESLKIAFLSKKLDLTPEEAQKFWPVYNQYISEMKKMHKEHKAMNGDELSLQEKALNITKKYRPDFLKCIGNDKFNRMLTVNRDWKETVRKELERRKQMRQNQRPNRPGRLQ